MDYKREISERLWKLGVTAKYRGFLYAVDAVKLVIEDEEYLSNLTTRLYPAVAAHYKLRSVKSVERDIRTVIRIIWEHHQQDLVRVLNYSLEDGKPTVGRFIDLLSNPLLWKKEDARRRS